MLVTFTFCEALLVPRACVPKARVFGERATLPDAPVPLSCRFCGLSLALSVREIKPRRVPVALGENVTEMEQLAPAARLLPHRLVCAKSPLADTLLMLNGVTPSLVRVNVLELLVVPTAWAPNKRLV